MVAATSIGPSADEKNWAMLCHLAAFCPAVGIPFGHIVGPLVVWMIKRGDSAFVDRHGRESLNFHISFTIYTALATILLFAPFLLAFVGLGSKAAPGAVVLPVFGSFLFAMAVYGIIALIGVVCTLLAAIKAANGEHYTYPFAFPFLQ